MQLFFSIAVITSSQAFFTLGIKNICVKFELADDVIKKGAIRFQSINDSRQ